MIIDIPIFSMSPDVSFLMGVWIAVQSLSFVLGIIKKLPFA